MGDKVTADDKTMGEMASGYWVMFGKTADLEIVNQLNRGAPGVDPIVMSIQERRHDLKPANSHEDL